VTRAIIAEMHKTNTDHVLLDLSSVNLNIRERFPSIYRKGKELKINIAKDLVPVIPAAHYAIGGIAVDSYARSSIKHLYACGECAATGVHGANRLASNSLLEGLVFGKRAAEHSLTNIPRFQGQNLIPEKILVQKEVQENNRNLIKEIMWQNVGIIRDRQSLLIAWRRLGAINRGANDPETNNLLTCALLTTQAALQRTESRGCHFRSDYPARKLFWKKHLRFKKHRLQPK
jgi:L-aspartate oxidase